MLKEKIKKIILAVFLVISFGIICAAVYAITHPVKDHTPIEKYQISDSSFDTVFSESRLIQMQNETLTVVCVEGFAYYVDGANAIVAPKFSERWGYPQKCTSEYKKHGIKYDPGYHTVYDLVDHQRERTENQ